jgi:hypothetical protein
MRVVQVLLTRTLSADGAIANKESIRGPAYTELENEER